MGFFISIPPVARSTQVLRVLSDYLTDRIEAETLDTDGTRAGSSGVSVCAANDFIGGAPAWKMSQGGWLCDIVKHLVKWHSECGGYFFYNRNRRD